MKKTRRWLAMLLAVVLVSSNVIYQLGTNMSASESDKYNGSTATGQFC